MFQFFGAVFASKGYLFKNILNLPITNGKVSSKIHDKRDYFILLIVNFLFLDGDVPLSPSHGVSISKLIHFI